MLHKLGQKQEFILCQSILPRQIKNNKIVAIIDKSLVGKKRVLLIEKTVKWVWKVGGIEKSFHTHSGGGIFVFYICVKPC